MAHFKGPVDFMPYCHTYLNANIQNKRLKAYDVTGLIPVLVDNFLRVASIVSQNVATLLKGMPVRPSFA